MSVVVGVLLLAVIDSINPSAIVVTLYLLSTARSRLVVEVVVYVSAIFVTYFLFGALLLMGIEWLVPSFGDLLRTRTGLLAQTVVGLALLAYALLAPRNRMSSPPVVARPATLTSVALLLLGVTVTAMELPTALPYFAAIALISEAELPVRAWAPLLVAYNAIFILPPVALLVGHLVLRTRLAESYAALGRRLERGARETMLWVAGLVGGALFVTGAIELAARLR